MVCDVQYNTLGLVLKMVIGGNKNLFIKNDKNFDLKIIKTKKI